LNYENSKVVNFTTLRDVVLKDTAPMHVHYPKKIKRKHVGFVISEPETKEYKFVFKKRRLMDNFDFLTYGFDLSILVRDIIQFNYLFIYLFILVGKSAINRGAIADISSV